MMGLIGFTTGVIGFLLHQLIEKIADVKWDITQKYIEVGATCGLFISHISINIVLVYKR